MNEIPYLDEVTLAPPRVIDPAIRVRYGSLAREIHESTEMCHGAARQCTVAVPPFEYAHDPAMGVHICQPARLASKSVVETDGYLPVVPRHRWVLMLASIEPATRCRKGGDKRIDASFRSVGLNVPDEYDDVIARATGLVQEIACTM
jgi:hypothetical protein